MVNEESNLPRNLALFFALIAGWVNVFGFFGWARRGVSHLTGAITVSGHELAELNGWEAASSLLVIASFVIGSALSAWATGFSADFRPGQTSRGLWVQAALLVSAAALLVYRQPSGEYLLVMAMGLQNGLVLRWQGALLRTTHVTGAFTEIGLLLGGVVLGRPTDQARLRSLLALVSCFMAGAALGTLWLDRFGAWMLAGPILATISAAFFLGHKSRALS